MTSADIGVDLSRYQLGWHDDEDYVFKPKKGLNEEILREMSWLKGEPEWMLDFRLKSLRRFRARPLPTWGGDTSGIDFDDIYYYIKPTDTLADDWDSVPESIKNTYEKLGIPEAERKYLAGVTAQYECLRGDVRVYTTERGAVPIKDVVPGDRVFALDEQTGELDIHSVKHAAQTDVRQTYEVVVGSRFHRTIVGTDNHPVLCLVDNRRPGRQRARYERRWKTIGELSEGDLVAVARDLPGFGRPVELHRLDDTPPGFPTHSSVDLMWFLGLWLGDGCSRNAPQHATYRVETAIPETETELQTEVVRVVSELFGLAPAKSDAWRLTFNSKALVEWLELNGFHGTSATKRIPAWVYSLTDEERLAFLGGYRTGMGGDRRDEYPDDVEELVRLTGDVRVTDIEDEVAGHCTDTLGFARVQSITEADVAPVYDIEIDGPHNFVAEGVIVHNSEVVYHRNREDLEKQGVLFCDMDTALREYPEVVKQYFGTVIPPNDNKFSSLNSSAWSGGSFIYVPPGVEVGMPLQAYFRINAENMGQFERTLIIADEGAKVHYIEGCSAPTYTSDSLHSAVVEIIVKPSARVTYTTIQNWSDNVYNLVTKRARVEAEGHMEWIDGNIGCLAEGSRVTTPGGLKPIELLTPGEQVLSYDEASGELCWRRVTAKKFSGEQPVREVRAGSRRLRVTDNHPFYSYTYDESRAKKLGRYELAYVRADELSEAIVPVLDAGPEIVGGPRFEGDPGGGRQTALLDRVRTQIELPETVEIRKVEVGDQYETVPTWDIEVEGTGNFVSEGFIVHNSRLTMKYPAVVLMGPKASGEVLSVAYAGPNQHQDTGAKMTHAAPETTSKIVSKSISKDGGRTSYRGLVRVEEDAYGCKSHVQCDALILDEESVSDTYPYMEVGSGDAVIGHEATVSRVADEQLFYLQSRGLTEEQAMGMIVNGFIEPVTRTLPMEYAVEWSRLIELQMEGSVG